MVEIFPMEVSVWSDVSCKSGSCRDPPTSSGPDGDPGICADLIKDGGKCGSQHRDEECVHKACGKDGASDSYICCPPVKDWSMNDNAYYNGGTCTWPTIRDHCKMNWGEPCSHNCQCPSDGSCTDGVCGGKARIPPALKTWLGFGSTDWWTGGMGQFKHCQLKENHGVASMEEMKKCLKTGKKPT